MVKQEASAKKMIAGMSDTMLLETWEATTDINNPDVSIVRGWLMDEIERRYPEEFNRWLDSEDCEDKALRSYIEK